LASAVVTGTALAKDDKFKLCLVDEAVQDVDQLKSRLNNCKKNEPAVVDVLTTEIGVTEVAGRMCDFKQQVLVEPTTGVANTGRVTCIYTGDVIQGTRG
jgi:hypothetical protein